MLAEIPKLSSRSIRSRPVRPVVDESGITMIELLVVILLIGILAVIAIPSFIGQKTKASNVAAKELVRTAETTAETMATNNNGHYGEVNPTNLNAAEGTIPIAKNPGGAYLSAASGGENEFSVTATSTTGDEFTIQKASTGVISRKCVSPVTKTGCAGGASASW